METAWPLKFGAFFSPIHSNRQNANLALHADLELIRHLDVLGFDEVWVGEHHSIGWECISSPELFIAYAAGQTNRIRFGTGVVSLPYHNPFMVAERMVLLDHLTRGRVIFGAGPGALVYDAYALGIEPKDQRRRMEESLEVILALLRGERISRETDWFALREAKLQLPCYTRPRFEVAVSSVATPSGARLAGKHGLSMLSFNATMSSSRSVLREQWAIAEQESAKSGLMVDRRNWRMVGPIYIAESEEQAMRDVKSGLEDWLLYMTRISTLDLFKANGKTLPQMIESLVESGFAVIGTPDQAIKQIHRQFESSGGFGTFLLWTNDWASRDATLRSYELFARHVVPAFQDLMPSLVEAEEDALRREPILVAESVAAKEQAIRDYARNAGKV